MTETATLTDQGALTTTNPDHVRGKSGRPPGSYSMSIQRWIFAVHYAAGCSNVESRRRAGLARNGINGRLQENQLVAKAVELLQVTPPRARDAITTALSEACT